MSKEESSPVIIKSEPSNVDVHYIDTIKVENKFLDNETEVDLEYIKEDIKEESSMEVKQEEVIINDEIPSNSNLTDDNIDNVMFTTKAEVPSASFNTDASISIEEKQFAYTFCQYKSSRKNDLKRHMDDSHMRKFQYAECEYETHRKTKLIQHMVFHTETRQFGCNLCEFKTAQKGSLKRHIILMHTDEKPFICNLCEFKTAYKHHIKRHMMKHTSEKPFPCNVCEFKFASKRNLKNHVRTHTGEKPFFCNVCDFKTSQNSYLKIHKRVHTGEKPFACNVCEFKTVRKGNLKSHIIRKHTSEKRFSCNLCEFKFATKIDLIFHITTHDGKQHDGNLCESKEDIKNEFLMEVKQEEISIKNEIASSSDT